MALIMCPECQKEISDRAHSCPVCGFPLDEYLEEQRELLEERERIEEEKARQKELEEKEKEYLKKTVFKIANTSFSYDGNERISAVIGANFQLRKEALHKKVQNMLLDYESDKPSNFDPSRFGGFAKELIATLIVPLKDEAEYLCQKYCSEFDQKNFLDEIEFAFDAGTMYRDLLNCHKEAYDTYDLNTINAHVQYYDDYTNAGAPKRPISAVYADTLGGLVGKTISARLINGATAALTSGGVRRREQAAENIYKETVLKEALICNAIVYSLLDEYVDVVVNAYRDFTFSYLQEEGEIFQITKYPKTTIDFEEYNLFLDDNKKTNEGKKERFLWMIKNNPGDFFVYVVALAQISFTEDELKEVVCLINYLDISEDVKRSLKDAEQDSYKLFNGEKELDAYIKAKVVQAQTYDGKVFDSIDEKELYVLEESKYPKIIKKFLEWDTWFNNSEYLDRYAQIVAMGQPHFEPWKSDYEKTLYIGKIISNAVSNNKFTQKMAKSIKKLIGAPVMVTTYKVENVIELRDKDLEEFVGLKTHFEEDELPIIRVRWKPCMLFVSTKAFYLIAVENKEVIVRFELDDIEYIRITQQGIIESRYLGIGIFNHGYEKVFDDCIPENDFKYVTDFIYDLNAYVYNNPKVRDQLLSRVLADTPELQLEESYLMTQIKIIAQTVCLISEMKDYGKNERVMKWVHEIAVMDKKWSSLKWIFERNHIGLEYVYAYDGYRIVTNKAIYITSQYGFPEGARIHKYEFENYNEILSVKTYGESWEASSALFFYGKDVTDFTWTGKENATFHQAIDAIAMVLCENSIKSKGLIDKEFLFCRDCKNLFCGSIENLKVCPKCKAKVKKSALFNYSGYKYIFEKYIKLSKEQVEAVEKKVMLPIERVIAEAKKQEKEKTKLQAVEEPVREVEETIAVELQKDVAEIDKIQCDSCGKMISKTAKFCNFCGKIGVLDSKECLSCGKKITATAKFCNYCGYRFD